MSRENVELVTGLQPPPDADLAWLVRDDAAIARLQEAVASLFHPDFEATAATGIGKASYPGLEGIRELWLDWLEPWETYRTEIEDAIDLGDDVLLLLSDYGRRAGTDNEVRLFGAAIWTVTDGKIARAAFYSDRDAALEAAGLLE